MVKILLFIVTAVNKQQLTQLMCLSPSLSARKMFGIHTTVDTHPQTHSSNKGDFPREL